MRSGSVSLGDGGEDYGLEVFPRTRAHSPGPLGSGELQVSKITTSRVSQSNEQPLGGLGPRADQDAVGVRHPPLPAGRGRRAAPELACGRPGWARKNATKFTVLTKSQTLKKI